MPRHARARQRIPYGAAVFSAVLSIAVYLLFFGWDPLSHRPVAVLVLVVGAGVLVHAWAAAPLRAHVEDVREDIYPHIFPFFGDDFVYSRNCPWSVSSLEGSLLIPACDDEALEHHVRGVHETVPIEIVEILKLDQDTAHQLI